MNKPKQKSNSNSVYNGFKFTRLFLSLDFYAFLYKYCSLLEQNTVKCRKGGDGLEIVVSNKTSRPLYEQISTQIKTQIMNGELKAGEAL